MSYPQYPGQYPTNPPPMPPKKPSPWTSPAVLVAVIAGLLILTGGIVAAVVVSKNNKDSDKQAEPSLPGATVTESKPPTVTETAQQPTVTVQPPTTTTPPSTNIPVDGANIHGFYSGPSCNGDDRAVFIGNTNRSRVVICQVGDQRGRNYYKGWADGKNSPEIGYPSRNGDTFVATNGNTDYIVSPSSLQIRVSGDIATTEPMVQSWVD